MARSPGCDGRVEATCRSCGSACQWPLRTALRLVTASPGGPQPARRRHAHSHLRLLRRARRVLRRIQTCRGAEERPPRADVLDPHASRSPSPPLRADCVSQAAHHAVLGGNPAWCAHRCESRGRNSRAPGSSAITPGPATLPNDGSTWAGPAARASAPAPACASHPRCRTHPRQATSALDLDR